MPPVLQDNYEPVEMDIDSNPGSPLDIGQGMEDLQMDQEFFNFPHQSLMMPVCNPLYKKKTLVKNFLSENGNLWGMCQRDINQPKDMTE